MPLQLGDVAPDFTEDSTHGRLNLHSYLEGSWCILFSHPRDFTPICTTELGELARRQGDFAHRQTKLLGVSVDAVDVHRDWSKDIEEINGVPLSFPLVGDEGRSIANLYGMIHPGTTETVTVRTVFVIGPDKRIKATLAYPMAVGRSVEEIMRLLDALQLADRYPVSTPVNWHPGDDLVVSPALSDNDAKAALPKGFTTVLPYLRITPPVP